MRNKFGKARNEYDSKYDMYDKLANICN